MLHAILAVASLLPMQAGVGEPKPEQPSSLSPIGTAIVDTGHVKRFKVSSGGIIEAAGPDVMILDGGYTAWNYGDEPSQVFVGVNLIELNPGEVIITMAGGSGNNAKSCSVTCGTVGNPPVQYFACCFIGSNGAVCECRSPQESDLDCTQGGLAATQCSTGN